MFVQLVVVQVIENFTMSMLPIVTAHKTPSPLTPVPKLLVNRASFNDTENCDCYSVTWQTGSFTPASGVTVYDYKIRKANGTLLVYLNIGFSGSYTGQKAVGTLSVGFRPSGSWVFPVGNLDVNADSRDDRYAQVDPDGTVKVVGPGRRMFVNGWMSL